MDCCYRAIANSLKSINIKASNVKASNVKMSGNVKVVPVKALQNWKIFHKALSKRLRKLTF
jgi:hypothetical protein